MDLPSTPVVHRRTYRSSQTSVSHTFSRPGLLHYKANHSLGNENSKNDSDGSKSPFPLRRLPNLKESTNNTLLSPALTDERYMRSSISSPQSLSKSLPRPVPHQDSTYPIASPPHLYPVAPRVSSSNSKSLERIAETDLDEEPIQQPPTSSSPRFSDALLPSSSPPTSIPDCSSSDEIVRPIVNAPPVMTGVSEVLESAEFLSRLDDLLDVAIRERKMAVEVEKDISATLDSASSVATTPEYPRGTVPSNIKRGVLARRMYSWSSATTGSFCSSSATARVSRSESLSSAASSAGYAADMDDGCMLSSESSSSPPAFKRSFSSLDDSTPIARKLRKTDSQASCSSMRSDSDSSTMSLCPIRASLRKSLSLRTSSATHDVRLLPKVIPVHSAQLNDSKESELPHAPTEPNSPPTKRPTLDFRRAFPAGVPVIAPPVGYVAGFPMTAETAAKARIASLVLREQGLRERELLDCAGVLKKTNWEQLLGVGCEKRRDVVEWLLEVIPPKSMYSRAFQTASGVELKPLKDEKDGDSETSDDVPDLIDQLTHSPETRFHAAHMFLRYFHLVMHDRAQRVDLEAMKASFEASEEGLSWDPSIPPDGWNLVVWDICVGCLAISVKIHRDVLEPLGPVMSYEYERIAPHEMGYDDLETAHRDILSAFDYSLGDTPQAILDEVWRALPSLRALLPPKAGWEYAQKGTWARLFSLILEPDVLKYPVSLLTVAVLIETLITDAMHRGEYPSLSSNAQRLGLAGDEPRRDEIVGSWEMEQGLEGVIQDLQAVVQVSDERLLDCRRWIRVALKSDDS
ncbi:unnamed protein product [Mycena citricolor]|uniref:Uncharacterized protein n=1 Tax=Mycena citricolor TaxID=2018698 RepID=A0AAD2HRZ0_9AGAR|nr:unnamed protein product [Mycena citricolor]